MHDIRITGIPEETFAVLRQHAAATDQSVEECALSWLVAQAGRSTTRGLRAHVGGSVSTANAVEAVRIDRKTH